MYDYNEDLAARIDVLHDEAEELADLAKHTADPETADGLRRQATRLVRQAARLRAQMEDE